MRRRNSSTYVNSRGFTLIELMIVVAIISILATLALPRFKLFQAKARVSEATLNMRTLETLAETYFLEKGEYANFSPDEQVGLGIDNGSGDLSTSCNNPNPYGFKITNCEKAFFTYRTNLRAVFARGSFDKPVYDGCALFLDLELELLGNNGSILAISFGPDSDTVDGTTSVGEALSVCF